MKLKASSILWMSAVAICLWFGSTSASEELPLLIKSVTDAANAPVRIVGLNGLCVTVSSYHNGAPVVLQSCKSNADVDQLFTFETDGTIQSNRWCIYPCGGLLETYIMIYRCPTTLRNIHRWEVLESGAIVSEVNSLALTAPSVNSTLIIDLNLNTPNQAWLPTRNAQPLARSIVGFRDLCLTHSVVESTRFCYRKTAAVWVEQCARTRQQWLLYGDGTIRPREDTTTCLHGNVGINNGTVRVLLCSPRSLGQRWTFRNDGTVWNLHYRQVLDVKQSDPGLNTIILYPNTGNPNQQWRTRA